jgi:hypothetical protein
MKADGHRTRQDKIKTCPGLLAGRTRTHFYRVVRLSGNLSPSFRLVKTLLKYAEIEQYANTEI